MNRFFKVFFLMVAMSATASSFGAKNFEGALRGTRNRQKKDVCTFRSTFKFNPLKSNSENVREYLAANPDSGLTESVVATYVAQKRVDCVFWDVSSKRVPKAVALRYLHNLVKLGQERSFDRNYETEEKAEHKKFFGR